MGKRGPQPQPPELKLLRGNPGKRPIPTGGPKASGKLRKPNHLSSYAKGVWDRCVASMPYDFYKPAERELLAAYCEAAALHRKAILQIRKEKEVVQGKEGQPYANPWVSILNRQATLLASLGTKLGLDPAARSTINGPTDQVRPTSKFAGLAKTRADLTG